MFYEIAYSIDGELKEVCFTIKDDAVKFYEGILDENKDNKDFEYINFIEKRMIGHYHRPGKMMRG